jgi:PAS domain S-box-containing protein
MTTNTPFHHPVNLSHATIAAAWLEAIGDAAFLKDTDLRYLACNQAFVNLLGLESPEAIVGKTDHDLNWQDIFDETDQAKRDDKPISEQTDILTLKANPSRVICINKRLLRYGDGLVIGILGIAQDITQTVQAQRAQIHQALADKAKSAFVANLSHDLRTPLCGITPVIECLLTDATEQDKELLGVLKESGAALHYQINQIVQYLQEDEYPKPLTKTAFPLDKHLATCIRLLKPFAAGKKLTLCLAPVDMMHLRIISDLERFDSIAIALITNAIDFTEQGKITVSARLDGDQLILQVQDTGIGIEHASQAEIFDPFRRLTPAYTKCTAGMGLGLTRAKQDVEALGGCITVESTPNQGSTFTCSIPIKRAIS